MKIAFPEKQGFEERWLLYCKEKQIDYKIVNPYSSDIIKQLNDCDVFMWQFVQWDYRDMRFAKQLLYSLQLAGIKVFPDYNTCWHFDDKVGQKYLFEALDIPSVPTYIFYEEEEAFQWIESVSFPKVFKLAGGAASANVCLAKSKNEARKFIKKAFGSGFKQYNWRSQFKESRRKYKLGQANTRELFRPLYYSIKKHPNKLSKYQGNEKGYVYFQDYIPNNSFDIRIVTIANKAYAIKRIVREGDFRASGSGIINYENSEIDERCITLAFDINQKIKSQCTAFDFIFDENHNPIVVEISYATCTDPYDNCKGYWDKSLKWHEGPFNPYGWMIDQIINNKSVNEAKEENYYMD